MIRKRQVYGMRPCHSRLFKKNSGSDLKESMKRLLVVNDSGYVVELWWKPVGEIRHKSAFLDRGADVGEEVDGEFHLLIVHIN